MRPRSLSHISEEGVRDDANYSKLDRRLRIYLKSLSGIFGWDGTISHPISRVRAILRYSEELRVRRFRTRLFPPALVTTIAL